MRGLAHLCAIWIWAAPRFAVFEAWAPRTMASGDLSYPQLGLPGFAHRRGAVPPFVTSEHGIEVRGAHASKIAKGAAASVVLLQRPEACPERSRRERPPPQVSDPTRLGIFLCTCACTRRWLRVNGRIAIKAGYQSETLRKGTRATYFLFTLSA
jgi:hypothetical protein